MFAYVQITDKSKVSYGYAKFCFDQQILELSALQGMPNSVPTDIPIAEINALKQDTYYRWNRIQFNYNNKNYIFLSTGTEELHYFQNKFSNLTVV